MTGVPFVPSVLTDSHLYIHGFTGSPASWDVLQQAQAFSVDALKHRLTLPGHAGSKAQSLAEPSLEGFDQAIDYLVRHAQQQCPPPWSLVGYSMGARLALGLALAQPQWIRELWLIGVHPGLTTDADRSARAEQEEQWIAQLEEQGIESFVHRWQQHPSLQPFTVLPAQRIGAQRRIRLSHHPQGLAMALRCMGLAQMPNYRPQLHRLGMPVHLVVGEADARFVELAQAMLPLLPQGRLHQVAGCAHNVPLERPEALAALLKHA